MLPFLHESIQRALRIMTTETIAAAETTAVKDGSPVVIKEGQATITFPNKESVFYNPVQEFNRDMSVAVIHQYLREMRPKSGKVPVENIKLLEAFSASGLRSIRYAKEIVGIQEIIANDISKKAVATIEQNIKDNRVEDIVKASHNDAAMAMYLRRNRDDRVHIIDLDPYGSPTQFLDAAVQSSADGALLCITCTDMAVLCGNASETCYTKYGAVSLHSKCCHEMAIRIVLQCVEAHANRYGRYIEPLLSLAVDFYCRVFVVIKTSQRECKKTTSKLGHVYQCTGCESMHLQHLGKTIPHENGKNILYKLPTGPPVSEKCSVCDRPFQIGGPLWLDPIHNKSFVENLLDSIEDTNYGTIERMKGVLSVISEELPDVPLYYTQDRLCAMIKAASGKMVSFRSALLNAGYRVSLSHTNKVGLKTDAPNEFIWDMMRAWEEENPINKSKLDPDSVPLKILAGKRQHEVSFQLHPDANPISRAEKLRRFQVNPQRNWGPKSKASTGTFEDDAKRIKNQGRKRKNVQFGTDDEKVNPPKKDAIE